MTERSLLTGQIHNLPPVMATLCEDSSDSDTDVDEKWINPSQMVDDRMALDSPSFLTLIKKIPSHSDQHRQSKKSVDENVNRDAFDDSGPLNLSVGSSCSALSRNSAHESQSSSTGVIASGFVEVDESSTNDSERSHGHEDYEDSNPFNQHIGVSNGCDPSAFEEHAAAELVSSKYSENADSNQMDTNISGITDSSLSQLDASSKTLGVVKVKSGDRPYKCGICDKYFKKSVHVRNHLRTHTGEKPLPCQLCDRAFARSSDLVNHMRIHTGERPYQCDVCLKTFKLSSNLTIHRRNHTGERPFKCDWCDKSFTKSQSLRLHKRAHTGEKPYICSICGKGFVQSSGVSAHMRVHTGERPYKCTLCDKFFKRCSHLKTHQRVHTGERPFQCPHCEKAFKLASNLKTHLRVHTGERPFSCDFCEKTFTQSSNLATHLRVHTGEGASSDVIDGQAYETDSVAEVSQG